MVNIRLVELQNQIKQKATEVNCTDVKEFATLAVALAVSKYVPIPSAGVEVEGVYSAFNDHAKLAAMDLFSLINETMIMDMRLFEEACKGYWNMRYECAHPNLDILTVATGEGSYLEKQARINTFISKELMAKVNQYAEALTICVNHVVACIKELKK